MEQIDKIEEKIYIGKDEELKKNMITSIEEVRPKLLEGEYNGHTQYTAYLKGSKKHNIPILKFGQYIKAKIKFDEPKTFTNRFNPDKETHLFTLEHGDKDIQLFANSAVTQNSAKDFNAGDDVAIILLPVKGKAIYERLYFIPLSLVEE